MPRFLASLVYALVVLLVAENALAARGFPTHGLYLRIKAPTLRARELAFVPAMERTETSFPQAYYLVADASALEDIWRDGGFKESLQPGVTAPYYFGYVVRQGDFSLTFAPKGPHSQASIYFHQGIEENLELYSGICVYPWPEGPCDRDDLLFLELLSGLWQADIFVIQGPPGQEPDEAFVPRFAREPLIHSQAEAEALAAPFATLEEAILDNPPVNLKPGMRLILPEKPAEDEKK